MTDLPFAIPATPRKSHGNGAEGRRKMRILFLVNSFPGTTETFIVNQITGLLDRGHDVLICASQVGTGEVIHRDVTRYELLRKTVYLLRPPSSVVARRLGALNRLVLHLPSNPIAVARAFRVCVQGGRRLKILFSGLPLLAERPCDAVLAHFGNNGVQALRLRQAAALSGRIATVFHGYDISEKLAQEGEAIYTDLFREGELFLPISERWRRRLVELGCPSDRTIVHRMGIDCRKFTFSPRKKDRAGRVEIVSVARLVEKKGLEYGLRAVAQLTRRDSRIGYTLVGDGPLKPDLERLASQLGISDSVRFLGSRPQDEVREILCRASIFLAPSITSAGGDQEGIPVALMEAMSSGLPVVATQHSGIPELVEEGISGFLTPERDAGALAACLGQLIEHPERWPSMGEAGRRKVEAEYNIEVLNDRLVDLLGRLCRGSHLPPGPNKSEN
jgi:colanic acid/amylovoran biosynthesis glycosyltransferase